jgi:hypothetical protein
MKRWLHQGLIVVLLLPASGAAGFLAQAAVPGPSAAAAESGELRDAIREHFANRLRQELALTDEQMVALGPLIDEIESTRAETRRERGAVVRSLTRGLRQGASDEELQALLDRLDAIDERQRAAERSTMSRIDEHLTVRQRVQFRFFAERFRRTLERRIQDLQRERRGGAGRPRGGPPGRTDVP